MALKFGILPAEILGTDEFGLPVYDDRAVTEEYFARYHEELVYNGISAKLSSSFQVMENGSMEVAVKPGAIFINGYFAYDEGTHIAAISAADTLARTDRVVMRLDKPNRKISIVVLKGTAGSTAAPSLVRNDDIWDMGLCTISIERNTTTIQQANITDTRFNRDVCGVVSNYLGDVDTTDLFAQYDNAFQTWFEKMKDQLSEDAAGNLQMQVDNLENQLNSISNVKSTKIIGEVKAYAGTTIPADCLLCNGTVFSPTTYPELYAAIGTTYGGTSSAPLLPNIAGRVVAGYSSSKSNFNTMGKTGGAETHTLIGSQIPSHSHTGSADQTMHGLQPYSKGNIASGTAVGAYGTSPLYKFNTGNTGGGEAHNNLQPYITMHYIIVAK